MANRKTNMNFRTQAIEVLSDPSFGGILTKWWMGGGIVTSALGWFSSSGAAVLIGSFITLAGFGLNYIYQCRENKRKEAKELREQTLAKLEEQKLIDENRRAEEIHQVTLQKLREGTVSANSE